MYPIGFATMAAHLRRHGRSVRIVNLALRMMRSRRFDPGRFLRKLRPRLFGIDLHWLPHAHGAPEVAALLKRLHPDIPVVFGGISSTYFHEEIVRDHPVDFVLRGSVTEPCLLRLVEELEGEGRFGRIPNLTWEDDGEVRVNPATFVPADFDAYDYDLGYMVREVVGRLDFWTNVPFQSWWRHPITAVLTVRGCSRNCVTCGASDEAFGGFMPGRHPLFRSPEAIARQVEQLGRLTRAPIFLVGDVNDGGPEYAHALVDELARTGVANRVVFEFFEPPPEAFLDRLDDGLDRWGAELSPESHHEAVRARLGKGEYTNGELEAGIASILERGAENLDLFYMIGLPGQTHDHVMGTVEAVGGLFRRHDRRLSAFVTPMGPFIDPGSVGFEFPGSEGYRLRARTLAEHRELLEEDSWESILNYETDAMSRARIVDATYDAAERLNALKMEHGRIDAGRGEAVARRISEARDLRARIRAAGGELDPETHEALLGDIRAYSESTANDKAELFPPRAFLRNFRLGEILRLLAGEALRSLGLRSGPEGSGERRERRLPDVGGA